MYSLLVKSSLVRVFLVYAVRPFRALQPLSALFDLERGGRCYIFLCNIYIYIYIYTTIVPILECHHDLRTDSLHLAIYATHPDRAYLTLLIQRSLPPTHQTRPAATAHTNNRRITRLPSAHRLRCPRTIPRALVYILRA